MLVLMISRLRTACTGFDMMNAAAGRLRYGGLALFSLFPPESPGKKVAGHPVDWC
jgi:hypothetical protein